MSLLFPEGIDRLDDLPYGFYNGLQTAIAVINWRENLEPEEVPPRRLWRGGEGLDEWFKEIDRQRKKRHGGENEPGPIDDPVQNDAARALIAG